MKGEARIRRSLRSPPRNAFHSADAWLASAWGARVHQFHQLGNAVRRRGLEDSVAQIENVSWQPASLSKHFVHRLAEPRHGG